MKFLFNLLDILYSITDSTMSAHAHNMDVAKSSKDRFFDMLEAPKEGVLYGETNFDFDVFIGRYVELREMQTDVYDHFMNTYAGLICAHDSITTSDELSCSVDELLVVLSIFLLLGSTMGRSVLTRHPVLYNEFVSQRAIVFDLHEKYGAIFPFIPPLLDDAYYEQMIHCWDKVRKSDGVFSEFDEYVVDSSNMMSEVLRFV